MLKLVANCVLASLKSCDVLTTVRLGFSLAAALLPAILNILQLKSTHHSLFAMNDDNLIGAS
jgi:hypothetical protein